MSSQRGASALGKSSGCMEPEGSLCCRRGVGGLERCSLLVLKSWESALNLEQKDTAIMCAFRPWVPSAEKAVTCCEA